MLRFWLQILGSILQIMEFSFQILGVLGTDVGIGAPDTGVQGPGFRVSRSDLGVLVQDQDSRLGLPDLSSNHGMQTPDVGMLAQGLGRQRCGLPSGRRRGPAQKEGVRGSWVGGQPGSPRARVGRGLGADGQTDRPTDRDRRDGAPRPGRGAGGGAACRDPSPAGAGAGAGQANRVRALPRPPRREPRAARVPALKGAGPALPRLKA
jgi:hypothetical protein